MSKNIKVSVVMPTYNRAKYIAIAIDSLLKQSYRNFELIIVDDASTDNTEEIVSNYKDNRIVYIKNHKNKGVSYSRNIGYKMAKGDYIAIADSDDINHKDRIKKMVSFLDDNIEFDIVISDYQIIDENGHLGNISEFRKDNEELRSFWIFQPGIPSFMMFRKKTFEDRGNLYHDETFKAAVDYQWYSSIDDDIKIGIIPEVLYFYRRHSNQISTQGYSVQQNYADLIRYKIIKKIGINPSPTELILHSAISKQAFPELDNNTFLQCINWLTKLSEVNEKSKVFSSEILEKVFADQLLRIIELQGYFNEELYSIYLNSRFSSKVTIEFNPIILESLRKVISPITNKIYIFGSKKSAYSTGKLLLDLNKDFQGFLDNNKEIIGDSILGKKIFSLDSIRDLNNIYIIITVLSSSRKKIASDLISKYKLDANKIIILADLN